MPTITINNIPIDFPNSAASPDWSEGIIQFAQAVEVALSGATSVIAQEQEFATSGTSFPITAISGLDSSPSLYSKLKISYKAKLTLLDTTTYAQSGEIEIINDGVGPSWSTTVSEYTAPILKFCDVLIDAVTGTISFKVDELSGAPTLKTTNMSVILERV